MDNLDNLNVNNEKIIIEISSNPIDISYFIKLSKDPESGALSIFIGTTRDNFEGKKVLYLEYEHHSTMAYKQLHNIAEKAVKEFELSKIIIVHRVGIVNITEESLLIISVSPHRVNAINSTTKIIEEVKKLVPIWKKEYYEENDYSWKENNTALNFM